MVIALPNWATKSGVREFWEPFFSSDQGEPFVSLITFVKNEGTTSHKSQKS